MSDRNAKVGDLIYMFELGVQHCIIDLLIKPAVINFNGLFELVFQYHCIIVVDFGCGDSNNLLVNTYLVHINLWELQESNQSSLQYRRIFPVPDNGRVHLHLECHRLRKCCHSSDQQWDL